jgi:hypothetical protein
MAGALAAIDVDEVDQVNAFDVAKKAPGYYQPVTSGQQILKESREKNSVPMQDTMNRVYNIHSPQAVIAEKVCRDLVQQYFPKCQGAVFLWTLHTILPPDDASKIAMLVSTWIMYRWAECNGHFSQRLKLTLPMTWVSALGLPPKFVDRYQETLRETEKVTNQMFLWKQGREHDTGQWMHGLYDPEVKELNNKYMASVLSHSISPHNFTTCFQDLMVDDEKLSKNNAQKYAKLLLAKFEFECYNTEQVGAGDFGHCKITGMPIKLQVQDDAGQWWVRQDTCGLGNEIDGFIQLCDEETTAVYAATPSEPKEPEVEAALLVIKTNKAKKELLAGRKRPLNASTYNHASDPAKAAANLQAKKNMWLKKAADSQAKALEGRGLPGGAGPVFITMQDKRDYWKKICKEHNAAASRRDQDGGGGSGSGSAPSGPVGPA